MDDFNKRTSRKQRRNNKDMGNKGRMYRRKRKRVSLTQRGRIVIIGSALLILGIACIFSIKSVVNRGKYIKAEYAYVTGDPIIISPQISGKIDNVNVKTGDIVNEKEELFTLETNLLKNEVDEAYANQELAFERLERAGGGLKWHSTKTKIKKKTGSVGNKNLAMLKNEAIAAQSRYNLARLKLENSRILAPVSGTIVQSNARIGGYVSPSSKVMSIVDFKNLNITAYFKQEKFSDIKKGAAVKILINSYPGKQFIGTVTSVGKSTAGVINLINSQENIEKSNLKSLIPATITFSYSSEQLVPGLDAIVAVQR